MPKSVAILAYGSLIADPGHEIAAAITERRPGVITPFNVEFARKSEKRGGAPTLVPVIGYGAPVEACLLILNVDVEEATHRLYRREINDVGGVKRFSYPAAAGPNTVLIKRLPDFAGIDVVLYTQIAATLGEAPASTLAALAIESVTKTEAGRDGISYLINAKAHGIRTAVSDAYEEEIKRRLGALDLEDALRKALARGLDPAAGAEDVS